MNYDYKLDENILKKHSFQETYFPHQFKCPLGNCISQNNNIYNGLTSTTLSRRFPMHLSDTSSIAQNFKNIHAQQPNFGKFLPKTQRY